MPVFYYNATGCTTFRGATVFDWGGFDRLIIGDSVKSISKSAFQSCGFQNVTIGKSLTSIAENAFKGCSWCNSLLIPESVTSIGANAFAECTCITSFTIPDGVAAIGAGAFWGCTGLTSLTIPATVSYLGYSAFSNCSGLTELHCKALVPLNILSNTFEGLDKSKCKLYVPAGTSTTYKNTTQWKDFTHMIEELAIKEYKINIDTSQYYIQTDTLGLSLIIDPSYNSTYWNDDFSLPCLLYTQVKILLPYGTHIDSCALILNDLRLWKEDIVLAPNPPRIPTGSAFNVFDSLGAINYPDSIYPQKSVLPSSQEWNGYKISWICVTPFVYNVNQKQLNLASSLTLQIILKPDSIINSPNIRPDIISRVKEMVINPEETDSYLIVSENTERGFTSLNVHAISNNGEVTIQLSDSYDTPFLLELFTIEGTKIKAIEINPGETEKTISGLKPGCYLFGLFGKSGERVNGKIMIK